MALGKIRGVFGVLLAVTACGGNVKGTTGTPSEELRANGESRCKAACATLVRCGIGGGSESDCGCGCSCPADSTDCNCGACTCTSTPRTPAKCESDCTESVQKVLDKTPDCDGQMLSLLDCVASAACTKSKDSLCKAEQDAFEQCDESSHSSSPPTAMPGGPAGAINCRGGIGGSAAAGPGGFQPGDLLCQGQWDACSDGQTYEMKCLATADGSVACDCSINGAVNSSFTVATCDVATSDGPVMCGWNIQ